MKRRSKATTRLQSVLDPTLEKPLLHLHAAIDASPDRHIPRARERENLAGSIPFTVIFYGSTVFCCKTAQLSERQCEWVWLGAALETGCATSRKTMQMLLFELQISCSTN
jgi:hypothetical protein